jgi:DNA-directed RNA polymerase beta' subunit
MSGSGSKGSAANTANITGLKGQEDVYGARPAMKISGKTRCLPYFDYNSDNIKARGFTGHSFLEGATPSEMYFISEGARVGGISIATSTADSGSLSHRLIKVFEDFKVAYDGSVRNSTDSIFQLGYFDGYDCGEVTNVISESAGDLVSFINLKDAANKINAEFM